MEKEKKEIYTLGTSNRSFEEFLEILKKYKIERAIDIRRWPTSRLFLHFKKEYLKENLPKNEIEYLHLEKLGGYRKERYQNYLKTKEFKEGFEELKKLATEKNTAIFCAEKFPWKCHRAFVGRELEEKGFGVFHIIEKEKIWLPRKETRKIKPKCEKS
jgi:uncharacterized protein (DUF488 family)